MDRVPKGCKYYRIHIGLRGITCDVTVDFRTPRNDADWKTGNYMSAEEGELVRLNIEATITNKHIRSTTHG